MHNLILIISFTLLAACTSLPDLPVPQDELANETDYPDFAPLESVVMNSADVEAEDKETEETLEDRVADLQSRAERLRAFDMR